MSLLKFSDGEVFDISGPFRKEERHDGWYAIGHGRLIPVGSEKEAEDLIWRFSIPESC